MTAATAKVQMATVPWSDDKIRRPMASTAGTFYPGQMMCYNSSGYEVNGADTAGLSFDGINAEVEIFIVPSGGSNGDFWMIVERPWRFTMNIASAALADIGKKLYIVDNQTVGYTSSNSILVGFVDELCTDPDAGVNPNAPVTGTIVLVNPIYAPLNPVAVSNNTLAFSGSTGANTVTFPANLANALTFEQGTNVYLQFQTTTGSEVSLLTAPNATAVTNAGGAVQVTAGTGGTTSGTGGTVTVAGGAGGAGATVGTGGAVSMTGGASTGSGAGGAASLVGGAGGLVSTGGAALVTGGAGGATSGNGGAVAMAGGAGTGSSGVGGAISATGGAGIGASAGGAASLVGGVGGTTGAGGAIAVTAGAGGATSGAGGNCVMAGGAGTAGNSAGGLISVTGGAGHGTQAGGAGSLTGGAGGATGAGGAVTVAGGAGGSSSGNGGNVAINGGGQTSGTLGTVTIQGANAVGANNTVGSAIFVGSTTALFGIWWGSGVPSNAATVGSIYIRSDGSSSNTRLYTCTVSTGTWVAFTSAS